mgnify:CR=1 FL=1
MVGSVVMRFFLGTGIDRHGPRVIWLSSLVVLAAVLFAHLGVTDYRGFPIYALRIVLCTAIAGAFGASATFIAAGTSVERMAELIGNSLVSEPLFPSRRGRESRRRRKRLIVVTQVAT